MNTAYYYQLISQTNAILAGLPDFLEPAEREAVRRTLHNIQNEARWIIEQAAIRESQYRNRP